MIDRSKKRNRQLAFELQNSHVCENRSRSDQSVLFFRYSSVLVTVRREIKLKDYIIEMICIRIINKFLIFFVISAESTSLLN